MVVAGFVDGRLEMVGRARQEAGVSPLLRWVADRPDASLVA